MRISIPLYRAITDTPAKEPACAIQTTQHMHRRRRGEKEKIVALNSRYANELDGFLLPHTSTHALGDSCQRWHGGTAPLHLHGPLSTAPLATTASVAASIAASIAAAVAASVAATVTATVAHSIAHPVTHPVTHPVEEAPALPEVRQAVPDAVSGWAWLAIPLELAGHECLDFGSAVIGKAFWQGVALNPVRLVSSCHRRDGLWLFRCRRQELDRIIASNSVHQAERSGRHFCVKEPLV